MSKLFSPLTLRGTTFPNRIWVSPMCQYSATDGVPNDWHLVHLGQFAAGGAGLVFTEASAVVPEGRITPEDAGLWNDEQAQAWGRVVDFVHTQGAAIGVQLAHAGRKASTYRPWAATQGSVAPEDGGWATQGPSRVAFEGYADPEEMEMLQDLVVAAHAEAKRKLEALTAEEMEKVTGGMQLPGGMKLPF